MAKEATEKNQEQSANLSMSLEQLQALITSAVAAAVAEAKKPYVDEADKARKDAEREQVRQEEENRIRNKQARQNACPHVDAYENFAFVGQRNCLGQIVFVCSQCCKPFPPGDPEYNNLIRFVKSERLGAARS
jgi:(p)ppGpp synthase/HD superfamily hydrolase